jgi:hypothetical protein
MAREPTYEKKIELKIMRLIIFLGLVCAALLYLLVF